MIVSLICVSPFGVAAVDKLGISETEFGTGTGTGPVTGADCIPVAGVLVLCNKVLAFILILHMFLAVKQSKT